MTLAGGSVVDVLPPFAGGSGAAEDVLAGTADPSAGLAET